MHSSREDLDFTFAIRDINTSTNTIKIIPDKNAFAAAQKRTDPYKNLPYIFRPVLEKIGDYMRREAIPRVFAAEGPHWAPLARRTVAERIAEGHRGQHPILRRSGDLFKELTDRSHPSHIEIIKTGKHARIEIGGSSKKFIQNQMGVGDPGQRLPRRSMVPGTGNSPLLDRDRIAMRNIVQKAIKDRIK